MALGGAISVIWGILLVIWRLISAVALTWWMAGYALFFRDALDLQRYQILGPVFAGLVVASSVRRSDAAETISHCSQIGTRLWPERG
jgi:hypothetical protein